MMLARAMAVGATAGALLAAPAAGDAALPTKKGRYTGAVAGGGSVEIVMTSDRRRQDFFVVEGRTQCTRFGVVGMFAYEDRIRLTAGGAFSRTGIDVDTADLGRVFENGVERNLFDVSRTEIQGRFSTARRATGTSRSRSVVFDKRNFVDSAEVVDRCDTGVLTWSARRR